MALACGVALTGAPGADAATPSTAFDVVGVDSPDVQQFARFPERLADAGDLNGDGAPDIFAANYKLDVPDPDGPGTIEDGGQVTLFSGRTREVIYKLTSPELADEAPNAVPPSSSGQNGPQFGFQIQVPGDLNGDGKDDLLVGAPYQDVGAGCTIPAQPEPNGCNENQGKAYAFSGEDGTLLQTYENPQPQSDEGIFATFGARLGKAGDIVAADGAPGKDGITEVIIGSPANDVPADCSNQGPIPAGCRKNEGEAFIFNGASGDLERTLRIPDADRQPEECTTTGANPNTRRCGNFSVGQGPGDVDGDGVPDQTVAAYSLKRPFADPNFFGRVYLFSGADGSVLARVDQPVPDANAFWGLNDVAPDTPGDVTGDGVPDLYAAGFLQDGPDGESSAGRGWVFDGAATVATGNGVVAFSPRDPTPTRGEAFGFSASRTDYNKDGRPDLYVSGLSGINTETYIFDGRGPLLKTLALPESEVQPTQPDNSGSGLGYSSRAPGDLNGDGEPDYVAGAPFQDVDGVQDQGKLYFFLSKVPPPPPGANPPPGGNPPPVACPAGTSAGVVCRPSPGGGLAITGTAGDDVILGSAGPDVIDGGGGNDNIDGNAGDDQIDGGDGNDELVGGDGDDTIDGGNGSDTIDGGENNDTIDGGDGDDDVDGGVGNDTIDGGPGDDSLSGNDGNDSVSGNAGNDGVSGNAGNDGVSGNAGRDKVFGRKGNDKVFGRKGNDRLLGGAGNDRALGGAGNDRISGQGGNDRLSGQSGRDTMFGGPGNDTMFGGSGPDRMLGRAGNDRMFGRAGDDVMFGNRGNDRLFGGAGRDVRNGGRGRDGGSP